MSSSNSHSPCAACKFLRRKCTQECVFAPYFPPEQPQKFASVHRVYGASNVAKILNEMPAAHREEAVASLAYEAEARLRDPVYGCVGFISYLHARLKQIHAETHAAKKELAAFLASSPQAASAAMMMMYPYAPASTVPPVGPTSASAAPDNPAQFALVQHQHQHQMFGGGGNTGYEQQVYPAGVAFVGLGDDGGGVVDGDGFPVTVHGGVTVNNGGSGGGGGVIHDYQIQQAQLLLNNVPHNHSHDTSSSAAVANINMNNNNNNNNIHHDR